MKHEDGFTLVEVAMAALITGIGLIFLASLFAVGINQNRGVKQFTTTELLAQQKIEELLAIKPTDPKFEVGGGLNVSGDPAQPDYNDTVYVNPETGEITNVIPEGATPIYHRYWKVEGDPGGMTNVRIISARAVADQPGYGRTAEETTLGTSRAW